MLARNYFLRFHSGEENEPLGLAEVAAEAAGAELIDWREQPPRRH